MKENKQSNEPILDNPTASFSKYRHTREPQRKSNEVLNSSEGKRRYYMPDTSIRVDRARPRGSLDRYDKYRYNVIANQSDQSIRGSINRSNKTEFSPFQPKIQQDLGDIEKENILKQANYRANLNRKREDTTVFSPYEDRFKHLRYDNLRKHQVNPVLPFHFNEDKKIADSLGNLRQRISKQLSFNHSRVFPHSPPIHELSHMITLSPRGISRDIIIEELTQSNQYLNEQIIQYKQIVGRLQGELLSKDSKILVCTETVERRVLQERLNSEKIIIQMRNQIKLLLEKNELLAQKVEQQQMESHYRERLNETYYQQNYKHHHNDRVQSKGRKIGQENENDNKHLVDELTQLINREYFQKIIKDKFPGKIKYTSKELKPVITQILKRNIKLESFASCVIDMKSKIIDVKDNDLKKCWKWLKALVEEAYRVKKLYEGQIRTRLHLKQGATTEEVCKVLLRKL